MNIIPENILAIVKSYIQSLSPWFSRLFYEAMLPLWKGEFLVVLSGLLDFGPLIEACAPFHHQQGPGRPAQFSVACLARAMLVRYLFEWSFETTEHQMRTSMVVKWFVGLPLGEQPPDAVTLFRFEDWVRSNNARTYFRETLSQIYAALPEQCNQPLITDTFAMRANAADETLIQKLRHTCHIALRMLKKVAPAVHEQFKLELANHPDIQNMLYPPKGITPERFLKPEERQQRVQATVIGVREFSRQVRLLTADCPVDELLPIFTRLADLDRVIKDEVRLKLDQGEAQDNVISARELPPEDKGSPRLGSATDREAAFRVHDRGKDVVLGSNVCVMTTPDGVVVEIDAYPGNTADQEAFPKTTQALIDNGQPAPPAIIVDRAGGSGKSRARTEDITDGQTQVVSHTMPYDARSDRFVPSDFILSTDEQTLTCPFGQSTNQAYNHGVGDGRSFRFSAEMCKNCPFNPHINPACLDPLAELAAPLPPSGLRVCRDPEAKPDSFRSVFVGYASDYRKHLEAAIAFNQTDAFKDLIKLRPRIEGTIANLTRHDGAGRAKGVGTLKADFQAKMCGVVHNLKLWVRLSTQRRTPARAG